VSLCTGELQEISLLYNADAEIAVWPNAFNRTVYIYTFLTFIKMTTSFSFDFICTHSSKGRIPEI